KTTSAASKKLKAGAAAQPEKKFVSRKLTPAERAAKIAQKKAIRAVVREKPAKAERKPRSEKNIRAVTVKETQLNAIEPAKKKTASGLDTFQRAAVAARLADDRKAVDILLLDVRGLCNFADIFVICSATNRVQLNAIAENISMGLKKMGEKTPLQDGHRNANWSVLDFGDVVIHVMSADARAFYRLEKLWGDAKELDWDEILSKMPKAVAN
ncbi:MAG: ribosome silencing factor, partial [Candidatus Sumerlaeota bacterium]